MKFGLDEKVIEDIANILKNMKKLKVQRYLAHEQEEIIGKHQT